MKVFLSWSGETSFAVAKALRDWLPYVIQAVRPFISSGDIEKGQRWTDVLANELNTAAYGIICVTPYNVQRAWLNFEAGAVSKSLDATSVSPFLFRLDPRELVGPLEQFQLTVYAKDDVLRLVRSINNRQEPDRRVPDEILAAQFEMCWPRLAKALDAIQFDPQRETETGFPWMYSRQDLSRMQGDGDCKRIWIISPDLYRHALAPGVKDELQHNIEQGIQYTFITSRSGKQDLASQALLQLAKTRANQIRIREVPEEAFRRLAATDYIIFNPDGDPLRMFLELPVSQRGYWIDVDGEAALNFVSRFRDAADTQDVEGAPALPAQADANGHDRTSPGTAPVSPSR